MPNAAVHDRLSILVVDDDELIRDLLGCMLEDAGHVVHAAPDGGEALAFLRTRTPVNIVLSDINMPGIDGLMLLRQIEAEFPQVPVLLISGRPPPDGVLAFMSKPFRSDTLAQAIVNLIGTPEPQPQRS